MFCSNLAVCWGVKGSLCGVLGRSKETPDRRWPQLCPPCTETAPSWASPGVPSTPWALFQHLLDGSTRGSDLRTLCFSSGFWTDSWGPHRVWEEVWSAPTTSPSLGIAREDRISVWLSKRGQGRHPGGWWAGREGGTHLSTALVSQCPSSAKPDPKSNEHKENSENQLHGSYSLISYPKAVLKSVTQKNPEIIPPNEPPAGEAWCVLSKLILLQSQ